MVDDDDVALHRLPPHFRDETSLPLAAFLPGAGIGPRVEFVPQGTSLRQFRQLGPIPSCRVLLPCRYGAILLNLFEPTKHRLISKVVELLAAKIIVAPLHITNRKPIAGSRMPGRQCLLEKRNVFIEKLLLKVLGP